MILCSWRRMAYYTTEPHRRLWCLLLLGVPDYWRWGELRLEVLKPDIKVPLGAVQRAHQRPGSALKMNTGNKIVGNFTCFHEIFRRALARKSWEYLVFFFTVHRTQTSAEKLALSVASECADVAYVYAPESSFADLAEAPHPGWMPSGQNLRLWLRWCHQRRTTTMSWKVSPG